MNITTIKLIRKLVVGCGLAAVLVVGIWAVNAAANYSGTWVLDKAKSQGLPPQWENIESYTVTVTQDGQQLTVETKIAGGDRPGGGGPGGGGGQAGQGSGGPGGGGRGGRGGFGRPLPSATYKLDGSETKVEIGGERGGTATLKAKWNDGGKVLELTTVRHLNFQGNDVTLTTKELWELSEDGKALKVKRTTETPRGTQESTLVFNKQ